MNEMQGKYDCSSLTTEEKGVETEDDSIVAQSY